MKKVLLVFSVIVMLFVASCQSSSVKEVSSDSIKVDTTLVVDSLATDSVIVK